MTSFKILLYSAGFLAVRLDHRAGTLRFGAPGLESDRMRDHIAQLARRMSTAQRMIQPAADPAIEQRRAAVSAAVVCLRNSKTTVPRA